MLRAYMKRSAWLDYKDSLKPELMGSATATALLTHLNALHESSDTPELTPEQVAMHIDATYGDNEAVRGRKTELLTGLQHVMDVPPVAQEDGVVHEIFKRYLAREWGRLTARTLLTEITSGSLNFAVAEEYLCNAVDAAEGRREAVLDYGDVLLPSIDTDRPGIVSTGLSDRLDAAIRGGIGNGELLLFAGGTGAGKTSALTAVAGHLLAQGKHVLYVTFEINEIMTARRVDANITGLSYDGMLATPGVLEAVKKRVLSKGGSLYIKNWSHVKVSANNVRTLVKNLRRRGAKIDVVIIDSVDLMVPDTFMQRREVRHNYGAVVEDTRRIAAELDVPIFSAWQFNREGHAADTPELIHLSETFDPARRADVVIGVMGSQQERTAKQMRVIVLKQRQSTVRPMFYLNVDLDRNQWHDSGTTPEGTNEIDEVVEQHHVAAAGTGDTPNGVSDTASLNR